MSFKPIPCTDRWYGVLAVLGAFGLDLILLAVIIGRQVDWLSFFLGLIVLISLPIIAWIGYRTLGAFSLEYWVDRDAVTLVWAGTRQIVPIGQIERILVAGAPLTETPTEYWHWPCTSRRRLLHKELGAVNAYATRPLPEQILLVTADECYGLTPADPDGFLSALQERFSLGASRSLPLTLQHPPLWTWPLWRDRGALLLIGVGFLGLVLMLGFLCFRFPSLSADLPLHFDVNGIPDRISPKAGLFALPIIGLLSWGFDLIAGVWLYLRIQRQSAYLLWGGAVAVQGIAGLALFNLMRW